jgi:hypothetical protein
VTAQIVPIKTDNGNWREGVLEEINSTLDKIEEVVCMDTLDIITKAIFEQKSSILGSITMGIIQKNHGDLINQEYSECPICKKVLKSRGQEKRTLETMTGKFDLYRPYFYCHQCKIGFYPLDEALGLASGSKQHDIQALEAFLGSEMTFEKASETFKRFTGNPLSADHVHETANEISEGLDILDVCPTKAEIEKKIVELSQFRTWRPVMMIAIDGANEPIRPTPSPWRGKRGKYDYKEAKGFRIYLIDSSQIVHLISWHQVQDDKACADAISTLKEAGLIPEEKVRLCIIGDGASWIWNRIQELFPEARQVLDFYHCSEYVHAVAKAQFGEKTKKAQEWVEATFTRLFANNVEMVIHGLKIMAPVSFEAQEKIEKAIGYLTNNKERANYGTAKRAGYHIGSGAIESANKFICHNRLKKSGAWWYISNSNNILKLRCAQYNGTFDRIMAKYMSADRERKYKQKIQKHLRVVK